MTILYLISGSLGGSPLLEGPAKKAFQSPMTRRVVAYVEAVAPGAWAFLTSVEGLVLPDQYLTGPQGSMRGSNLEMRREWSERVYESLHYHLTAMPRLTGVTFLCSPTYHAEVAPWIVRDFQIPVLCPFDHLNDEAKVKWLKWEMSKLVNVFAVR